MGGWVGLYKGTGLQRSQGVRGQYDMSGRKYRYRGRACRLRTHGQQYMLSVGLNSRQGLGSTALLQPQDTHGSVCVCASAECRRRE